MRSEEEIRARLAEIEADSRLRQKSATVFENAPLALIQLELESKRDVLRWVLGENRSEGQS
jgi:hypothetical protein